ncbi:MAG TPA: exopolysaccharide biosynthesis protein [Gammaproteobacteria bacterium]|jgi:hypothetical protein
MRTHSEDGGRQQNPVEREHRVRVQKRELKTKRRRLPRKQSLKRTNRQKQNGELTNLEQLLDRIDKDAVEGSRVSVDAILDAVGRRSFGPLLLVAGLITLTPVIGDIPGVPTLMGVIVLLTAVQLLFRRDHFWLPHWILDRTLPRSKLCKMLKWLRPPARFLDRLTRPRLSAFTRGVGGYVIATACLVTAITMPATEVVLFSANVVGLVLTLFGLALIARDGLLALLALGIMAAALSFVIFGLF